MIKWSDPDPELFYSRCWIRNKSLRIHNIACLYYTVNIISVISSVSDPDGSGVFCRSGSGL